MCTFEEEAKRKYEGNLLKKQKDMPGHSILDIALILLYIYGGIDLRSLFGIYVYGFINLKRGNAGVKIYIP
jgi:hypothetical protein